MSTTIELLRVLITRPLKQAETLAAQLRTLKATPFIYPVLHIEPVLPYPEKTLRDTLQEGDWLIFTSAHAVWSLMPALSIVLHATPNLRLIAIGKATGEALIEAGFSQPLIPSREFSSEGLLQESEMQDCQGKRIILVTGVGGRAILNEELTKRGAIVTKLPVYRRLPGFAPSQETIATWQTPGIDVVISTSAEGLCQLVDLISSTGKSNRDWLLAQQLLVLSQRLVPVALEKGFLKIPIVAKEATNAGLISALQAMDILKSI
ncbi:MAG: hemDX [Gammaproteobacteria bacterium]|jgi:uroporphyrinogen-III synthase|nr:hemDX [Gammaproteobacteria bacterium]